MSETVISKAEKLVISSMKGNDASHAFRVRDLALSLAKEEGLSSSLDSMEIVELAALSMILLTDFMTIILSFHLLILGQFANFALFVAGDYKYVRDPSEEMITERFLEAENVEESKRQRILSIIQGMGFKEELAGNQSAEFAPEFGVVQDADRLDAIGAVA
ncbi:hypothetical protein MKW98_007023 [Papaver atlanticum]|uniref:Uncharacterized protein n=1 Tax=Papaver atlanticum TaxID=357466 RepID=A0AAD4SV23_9MAGN|nr:hypothetical protein MKW98_007023 [Papaver atlanticum]